MKPMIIIYTIIGVTKGKTRGIVWYNIPGIYIYIYKLSEM